MATNNNAQQSQPGPIAQQLTKLQSNGHQAITPQLNGQQPPVKKDKWGFSDKTFWDWLLLIVTLLGAIAIPFVVTVIGLYATQQITLQQAQFAKQQAQLSIAASDRQHQTDLQIAKDNHQNDLKIADDQQQETTLEAYLDDMSTLLLQDNLRNSRPTDEVREIARAKTLTVLSRLGGQRKGVVVRFLYETGLISFSTSGPIVILYSADLTGINLHGGELQGVDLVRANLNGADLSDANLSEGNLSYTSLIGANLEGATLTETIVNRIRLDQADLIGANLKGAYIYTTNQLKAILKTSLLELQTTLLSGAIMPDGSQYISEGSSGSEKLE